MGTIDISKVIGSYSGTDINTWDAFVKAVAPPNQAVGQAKADATGAHFFRWPSLDDIYCNKWSICGFNNAVNGENTAVNALNSPLNGFSFGVTGVSILNKAVKTFNAPVNNDILALQVKMGTLGLYTHVLRIDT